MSESTHAMLCVTTLN